MDYQNRVGNKQGGGGLASSAETNLARRGRVRELLAQANNHSIDSDPYVFKNRSGHLECRLCLTIHISEQSYINHLRGKKHQASLQKRQSTFDKGKSANDDLQGISSIQKKHYVKIGTPAYQIRKIRHPVTDQLGLTVMVEYTRAAQGVKPLYRFMNYYEQNVEKLAASEAGKYQYLIITCEPYQNICIKIPSMAVIKNGNDDNELWDFWDQDIKTYYIQFFFA